MVTPAVKAVTLVTIELESPCTLPTTVLASCEPGTVRGPVGAGAALPTLGRAEGAVRGVLVVAHHQIGIGIGRSPKV